MGNNITFNIENTFNGLSHLCSLRLHDQFNIPVTKGILTENLTILHLGTFFNQLIEKNALSHKLQELTFGNCYNRAIEIDVISNLDELKSVTFGHPFNKP